MVKSTISENGLLSIGELATRAGVATSVLRYYDELGLVRPAGRSSGQRRYAATAVSEVGLIRLLRDVGFTLAEIGSLIRRGSRRSWKEIVEGKLAELAEQQHRIEVARDILEHGRRCPAGKPLQCPRLWSIVDGHLQGQPLPLTHARVH